MAISYHTQDCGFALKGRRKTSAWIKAAIEEEKRRDGDISVIFCSDHYLLTINREHLSHDYFTDIITFDYSEGNTVSGDLFISVDTVHKNAAKYGVSFENELLRVIIHGVMHLCGYKDKTDPEAFIMREKEDYYLSKTGTCTQ